MNPRTGRRSPELLGLLGEIARDPAARWLAGAAAARGTPPATRVERHLLAAHRDELRELLLWACLRELYDHAAKDRCLHHGLTRTRRLELPDARAWKARARAAIDNGRGDEGRDEFALLERALKAGRQRPRASEYALAALRVAAHDSARINLGLALASEGRAPAALQVLEAVAATTRPRLYRSIAHENRGFALSGAGELERAREAYAEAARTDPERPSPAVWWLALAIATGDRRHATRAAAHLAASAPPGDPTVAECARAIAARRPDRAATRFALELSSSVPDVAGEVLHAFQG